MIKEVKGNIFNFTTKNCIILHQVNAQGVMGGGIAKTVKELFPNTYSSYKQYCNKHTNKKDLLGMNYITTELWNGNQIDIGNCFGQLNYGRNGCYTDYNALRKCFEYIDDNYPMATKVLIPKYIGCGLAGGEWNIVSQMIEEVFFGWENVLLVDFDGSEIVSR